MTKRSAAPTERPPLGRFSRVSDQAGLWRAGTESRQAGDQGFGLLDALLATIVLLIIAIPVANLVASGGNLSYAFRDRSTASNLASGVLDQIRAQSFPPTNPSLPTGTGSQGSPWVSTGASSDIDTETYRTYVAGGWCTDVITSGVAMLTNGAANNVVYVVAAKVAWGPNGSSSSSVDSSVTLTTVLPVSSYTLPTGTISSCPVGSGGLA